MVFATHPIRRDGTVPASIMEMAEVMDTAVVAIVTSAVIALGIAAVTFVGIADDAF